MLIGNKHDLVKTNPQLRAIKQMDVKVFCD